MLETKPSSECKVVKEGSGQESVCRVNVKQNPVCTVKRHLWDCASLDTFRLRVKLLPPDQSLRGDVSGDERASRISLSARVGACLHSATGLG